MLVAVTMMVACAFLAEDALAYEIQGVIYSPSGKGIPDVWVELLDDAYGIIKRVRTDGLGRYRFSALAGENDYIIRVLTDGIHLGQERRVETGRDTATAHESTDFHLKRHPEFESSEKPANPSKPPVPSKPSAAASPPATPTGSEAHEVFVQEVPPAARQAYEEGVRLLDKDAANGRLKLKEATELFPTYFAALERQGVECVKAGEWETAAGAVKRAIAVNPRSHVSYYALGVAQYQLKQLPEAGGTLAQMLSMAPNSPNAPFARYYLGMSLVKTGQSDEAERQLRLAKQQGGGLIPSDVHLALAQILSNTNRYAEAAGEIEELLKESPGANDSEHLRQLAAHLRAKAASPSKQP